MNRIIKNFESTKFIGIHKISTNQCLQMKNIYMWIQNKPNLYKKSIISIRKSQNLISIIKSSYHITRPISFAFSSSTSNFPNKSNPTPNSQKQDQNSSQEKQKDQKIKKLTSIIKKILKPSNIYKLILSTITMFIFGGIYTYFFIYQQLHINQKIILSTLEKQKAKFHGQTNLHVPDEYIQGNVIEKKIEKIITQYKGGKEGMKVVSGQNGVGQSTAINYVVNKLRNEGYLVYYMDIKQMMHKYRTNEQRIEQINFFLYGLIEKTKNMQIQEDKKVKIILNNVQYLQPFIKDDDKQRQILNIYICLNRIPYNKKYDVICISNSSTYFHRMRFTHYISNYGRFYVINNLKRQNYEQFAHKIIKKYEQNLHPAVQKFMLREQYPIKKIVQKIKQLKTIKLTEEEQIKHLKEQDLKQLKKVYNFINQQMNQYQQKSQKIQFLQAILYGSQKKQTYAGNQKLSRISWNYETNQIQKKVIKELESEKLMSLCVPTTKLYAKAFEQVLNDFKS